MHVNSRLSRPFSIVRYTMRMSVIRFPVFVRASELCFFRTARTRARPNSLDTALLLRLLMPLAIYTNGCVIFYAIMGA